MTEVLNHQTFDDIFKQGQRAAPTVQLPSGAVGVVLPAESELRIIDPVDKPEPTLLRIKSNVTIHERDSFVAYVNRYKTDKTQVFAEPGFLRGGQGARVTADMDYHLPGAAQRREHFVHYVPRYSDQWSRWKKLCSAPLKQVEFAEAIEECRADITAPSAASLLDIVRTFKAQKKVEFDSVVYQPDGTVKLNYSEEVQKNGAASGALPEAIQIGIPVYFRGTRYAVNILVRYRVGNGGVTFDLKMDRPDVVEDNAFEEITAAVAEQTACPVYLGNAT
jgi:hypothetical protein